MRFSRKQGGIVRQLSTEVLTDEHQALRDYARRNGITVDSLLRELVKPVLQQAKQKRSAA